MTYEPPTTTRDYLQRYPRTIAHIICHSLGYATPMSAAQILRDAHERRYNACEWIACCYRYDPRPAVRDAIRGRHHHHGYMAEYNVARRIVDEARTRGNEPHFGSWF